MIPESFETFEVGLLGGPSERRYRRMRPEVERMPWGTLDLSAYPPAVVAKARRIWTMAAYQEYRTGASVTAALQHLFEVSAPVDLIAIATRFPLDEIVHVELCARLLDELGGAVTLKHDPDRLAPHPPEHLEPLLRCAVLITRVFCVGEAVSIPILRTSAERAEHPLIRAVLARIAKDEALHGQFGWMFLDWIGDALTDEDRALLRSVARDEIRKLERAWQSFSEPSEADVAASTLGWMQPDTYFRVAHEALDRAVLGPLTKRGLDPRLASPIDGHPLQ